MLRKVPGGSDPEQFAISKDGKTALRFERGRGGSELRRSRERTGRKDASPRAANPRASRCRPTASTSSSPAEDEGTVAVVDVASQSVVKTIKVGRRPRGIVFLPDGSRAFVTQ